MTVVVMNKNNLKAMKASCTDIPSLLYLTGTENPLNRPVFSTTLFAVLEELKYQDDVTVQIFQVVETEDPSSEQIVLIAVVVII
jgi:maleate cis-trans isomerase